MAWSLWEDYLKMPSGAALQELLAEYQISLTSVRTSVTLHAYRSTLVLAGLPLSPFGGPVVTSAARLGKSPGVGSKWQARRLARRNHCRPARASLPGQPARASPAAGYCRVAGRSLRTSAEIAAQAS